MKAFLANMNLARWVILASLVGSIGLGWWGWNLHEERVAIEAALELQVPRSAQNIQVLSMRHSKLHADVDLEGLRGQDSPDTYIRRLATHQNVALGGVRINAMPERSPRKGVVDRKYSITPQEAKKTGRGASGFDRARIVNYLWLLEQQSRRVRVTNIRLDPTQKTEPWVPTDDQWSWDVEVTSRQKIVDS